MYQDNDPNLEQMSIKTLTTTDCYVTELIVTFRTRHISWQMWSDAGHHNQNKTCCWVSAGQDSRIVYQTEDIISPCSFGLSATSQQYFSLRTNQPPATSQQYFSLKTNQHQPSATIQTNRLHATPKVRA
jgi:hypothetical protein